MPLSLLLAFCSPYPVRFAIEGKSYALLVLLVRWPGGGAGRSGPGFTEWPPPVRLDPLLWLVCGAGNGHLGCLQQRRQWALAAGIAALPAVAWIAYASDYLFSARSGSWIGSPDFALLEETLARGFGLWPLPKLALLVLLIWGLRRWGGMDAFRWPNRALLDRSGLIPSGLMVIGVVLVSFIKPLAFSRYFVVLLPAVVPVLALQLSQPRFSSSGRRVACAAVLILLLSWWGPGFAELDPVAGGVREQDQFRLVSQRTSGLEERYSPRARLLSLSDRMEVAMGRIPANPVPWGDGDDLEQRLAYSAVPAGSLVGQQRPAAGVEPKTAAPRAGGRAQRLPLLRPLP